MTSFVEVPGGRLWVVDEGAGPPIVLLHAGHRQPRELGCAWPRTSPRPGYRVVRYDAPWLRPTRRRMTCRSPNRRTWSPSSTRRASARRPWSATLAAAPIAFDTAIEFPDRVVAVVGVGAGLAASMGTRRPRSWSSSPRMDAPRGGSTRRTPRGRRDRPPRLGGRPGPAAVDRVPAWIREAVRSWDEPHLRGRTTSTASAIRARPAGRGAPGRAPRPGPGGRGRTRQLGEVAQTARHLEAHAPHARAIVWDDVAHMIGMEAAGSPRRRDRRVPGAPAPLELDGGEARHVRVSVGASPGSTGVRARRSRASTRLRGLGRSGA